MGLKLSKVKAVGWFTARDDLEEFTFAFRILRIDSSRWRFKALGSIVLKDILTQDSIGSILT